jgi:hypothetical protein
VHLYKQFIPNRLKVPEGITRRELRRLIRLAVKLKKPVESKDGKFIVRPK